MTVTHQEFNEWKQHPTTKTIFAVLQEQKQVLVEQACELIISRPEAVPAVLGRVQAYDSLLNMSVEEGVVE